MKIPKLKDGELYAGIVLGNDGKPYHHLVLLPAKTKKLTWPNAVEWAASVGGELPTRQEQSVLFANLRKKFGAVWYWSGEKYDSFSYFAWVQTFSNGHQSECTKSQLHSARAVRRVFIGEQQ